MLDIKLVSSCVVEYTLALTSSVGPVNYASQLINSGQQPHSSRDDPENPESRAMCNDFIKSIVEDKIPYRFYVFVTEMHDSKELISTAHIQCSLCSC